MGETAKELNPLGDALGRFFRAIAPLPEEEWELFGKGLRRERYAPGEAFLRAGGPPDAVGFVERGLIKAFYMTRRGDEFIRHFSPEGGFVAAYVALLTESKKSEITAVAVEPTELTVFDYASFRAMLGRHSTWQQIGRVIAEQTYLIRERRQFELLTMSAEERLTVFFATHPGLGNRISQKDLAAYIGITPVSLSRLRAKMRSER